MYEYGEQTQANEYNMDENEQNSYMHEGRWSFGTTPITFDFRFHNARNKNGLSS